MSRRFPNIGPNIGYVDLLTLAGVIFLGVAIVTYVTSYWDVLPRGAYLVLFLLGTTATYIGSALATLYQRNGLADILLFIGCTLLAAAFMFITFAYNINPQATDYIAPVLFLAMIVSALIYPQRVFLLCAILAIAFWMGGPSTYLIPAEFLIHIVMFVLMSGAAFFMCLRNQWRFGLHMMTIFYIFLFPLLIRRQLYVSQEEITLFVTLILLMGVPKGLLFETGRIRFLPARLKSFVTFFQPTGDLIARYCAVGSVFLFLVNPPLTDFPLVSANPWLVIFFAPLAALLILGSLFLLNDGLLRRTDCFAFSALCVILILAVYAVGDLQVWLYLAGALGLVLWLIDWGTARSDTFAKIAGYIFLPGALCYAVILTWEMEAWKQSLLFLLAGVIIIAYGFFHNRQLKKLS